MTEEVKQIKIGVIDSSNKSLDILTKVENTLTQAIQKAISEENTTPLSDIITQVTSQTIIQVLDVASEAIKDEEAETVLAEAIQESGYTVNQIQEAIELAKNAVNYLPPISNQLLESVVNDVKNIISKY